MEWGVAPMTAANKHDKSFDLKGLFVTGKTQQYTSRIRQQIGAIPRRACACGGHPHCGESESCRKKREVKLQCAAVNSSSVSDVPPIVNKVLRMPGQPLNPETRAFFEPRFGHDFSRLRVNAVPEASHATEAVLGGSIR